MSTPSLGETLSPIHPPLTVEAAIELLTKLKWAGHGNDTISIAYEPGHATIGATPSVAVTGFTVGFDWNHGKIFANTETKLGVGGPVLESLRARYNAMSEALYKIGAIANDGRAPDERLAAIKSVCGKKVKG
ncbi:peptide-binding protein [Novimethylophilus kurashikiensis]|uniref:Peptide-binding protein n=1 Tax=Novimethylophilus kurashikiensis TaxID=1825523 RepID=A0A2R5FBG6_9PROT|nr:hypothetical protein [Novimethylophilus kurashikiensis]GBG14243.1 peptide-binding protein [Novimethylophilus kurashikiensis]